MAEVSDEAMMAAVASGVGGPLDGFTVLDVSLSRARTMLVRFTIDEMPGSFGVRLPLPSSDRLKPWLHDGPDDPQGAAEMLNVFMAEEVYTDCALWVVTEREGEVRLFQLEPYGFRRADETRHQELLRAAGADGWWGYIQENGARRAAPARRHAPPHRAQAHTRPRRADGWLARARNR